MIRTKFLFYEQPHHEPVDKQAHDVAYPKS